MSPDTGPDGVVSDWETRIHESSTDRVSFGCVEVEGVVPEIDDDRVAVGYATPDTSRTCPLRRKTPHQRTDCSVSTVHYLGLTYTDGPLWSSVSVDRVEFAGISLPDFRIYEVSSFEKLVVVLRYFLFKVSTRAPYTASLLRPSLTRSTTTNDNDRGVSTPPTRPR